jgi:hypothetical protein
MCHRINYVIAILAHASGVCLGCDSYHILRFTNRTNDSLLVDPLVGLVKPCSVKWANIGFGAGEGRYPVTAQYLSSQIAFKDSVPSHFQRGLGVVYDVILLSDTVDRCPSAITDRFQVSIDNQAYVGIKALFKGVPIGFVVKRSFATLGPIKGSIDDISELTFVPESSYFDYDLLVEYFLGQIPAVKITFRESR